MNNPNIFYFWDSCLLQSEHFSGNFVKFCLYIGAKFLKIFIRPCYLYSGVLPEAGKMHPDVAACALELDKFIIFPNAGPHSSR